MNDPGHDEAIKDSTQQVQENLPNNDSSSSNNNLADGEEADEDANFLLPAKWWYASTGFPLMAGTFGPMANAFSICALVENWRVSIPPGGTEEHGLDIADPRWLIAVNAVSLVFALTANMSLLLNMARRLRFEIAQPITIIGFSVASVLLIILVGLASQKRFFHAPGVKDQALTQAYYYAIFAAGLYQIISFLMCVTVVGAYRGHYSKEFKLTISQRTLMLQTISFLTYLLLGALVYSKIEGWKFLDAVYWADFTCLTIGVGDDYTPETHLGRSLLFPFALGGIVILGLVVGSIRSLVLDRSKKKLSARMTEKMRRRVLERIHKAEERANKDGKCTNVTGLDKKTAKILTQAPSDDSATEVQRRKAEFEAMRVVQDMAAQERKWFSLAISTFAFAFLWTIGALVFWQAEKNQNWSYFEAFYFSYTTLLTIGYGDFQPISNSGKPFFVFWSLLAIPTLTILISNMGDTVVKAIKDVTIWLGEITVLPSDQGGVVDRLKYGVAKATKGRVMSEFVKMEEEKMRDREEVDDDFRNFQEMNPGLVKMTAREDTHKHHRFHRRDRDLEAADRLGADMETSERNEEESARNRGDALAEDEHHYRHILISQIRKVYRDSSASTPKKYRYDEWAFFLALLGEDEDDPTFHRKAPVKTKDGGVDGANGGRKIKDVVLRRRGTGASSGSGGGGGAGEDVVDEDAAGGEDDGDLKGSSPSSSSPPASPVPVTRSDTEQEQEQPQRTHFDGSTLKWSWIGNRSPLMAAGGDQSESEWLLEKLFSKLEIDLREQWEKERKNRSKSKNKKEGEEAENEDEGEDEEAGDKGEDKEREEGKRKERQAARGDYGGNEKDQQAEKARKEEKMMKKEDEGRRGSNKGDEDEEEHDSDGTLVVKPDVDGGGGGGGGGGGE